jgi:multicomponent Na+:H+ antiporter subunit C
MLDFIIGKYNYWIYIALMMIGFYAMIGKKNLVKKIIGMNIFQTAIILFYISTAYKKGGATLPIIEHAHAHGHGEHVSRAIEVSSYLNPLPHVLMLTAIVVMVATLGVALAIVIKIYRRYNTLEEDEILKAIK